MKLIDDKVTLIDTINSLFEWLYNIQELTIETVAKNIIQSIWIKSKEDIQELISFILQVIKTRLLLHPFLIDLVISIDKLTNNEFNIMSILITQLMYCFSESKLYCSFVYRLYKKGIITMNEIIDNIYINYIYPLLVAQSDKNNYYPRRI